MKRRSVNILGSLGYISLAIQWLWMIGILGMPILVSDWFKGLFLPNQMTSSTPSPAINVPEPLAVIFLVLAVVFSVSMIVYTLVAVPRAVGKTGKKITMTTAKVIIPKISHHKPISKKREKTLVERITWSMKFAAAIVPIFALAIPPRTDLIDLSHQVVVGVGLFCASLTLLWFGGQFLLSKLFRLSPQDIW